jgi:hypothetical protein
MPHVTRSPARSASRVLGAVALSAAVGASVLGCREGAPAPPPRLSFLAVGDTGRRDFGAALLNRQMAVARGIAHEDARSPVDAFLLLGDNFYPHGLEAEELVARVRLNVVRPYCRFILLTGPRSTEVSDACPEPAARRHVVPIYAVLGNHDYDSRASPDLESRAVPAFVANWHLPRDVASVAELGAGVSLILLDSNQLLAGADPSPLTDALRRARGPWRILAAHHPVASRGKGTSRGSAAYASYTEAVRASIEAAGVPVQLFLSGHEHDLEIVELPSPWPRLNVVAGGGSGARSVEAARTGERFALARPGFARIDLASKEGGDRLVASVFALPSQPVLSLLPPRRVARWSVDASGRVREEPGSP